MRTLRLRAARRRPTRGSPSCFIFNSAPKTPDEAAPNSNEKWRAAIGLQFAVQLNCKITNESLDKLFPPRLETFEILIDRAWHQNKRVRIMKQQGSLSLSRLFSLIIKNNKKLNFSIQSSFYESSFFSVFISALLMKIAKTK